MRTFLTFFSMFIVLTSAQEETVTMSETAATTEAQEEYFQKPAYCGSLECPRYKLLEQYDVSVKQ